MEKIFLEPNDPRLEEAAGTYICAFLGPLREAESKKAKGKKRMGRRDFESQPNVPGNQIPKAFSFDGKLWISPGSYWCSDGERGVFLQLLTPREKYIGEVTERYCPERGYVGMLVRLEGTEYVITDLTLTLACKEGQAGASLPDDSVRDVSESPRQLELWT